MKKRMKRLPTYRKRVFLNHISTGLTSYIFFEVDSSQRGKYPLGNYILRIADCEASLFFEFGLTSKHRRRESLKKIDLLLGTLTDFRERLHKEANLIEAYREPRNDKKKS